MELSQQSPNTVAKVIRKRPLILSEQQLPDFPGEENDGYTSWVNWTDIAMNGHYIGIPIWGGKYSPLYSTNLTSSEEKCLLILCPNRKLESCILLWLLLKKISRHFLGIERDGMLLLSNQVAIFRRTSNNKTDSPFLTPGAQHRTHLLTATAPLMDWWGHADTT